MTDLIDGFGEASSAIELDEDLGDDESTLSVEPLPGDDFLQKKLNELSSTKFLWFVALFAAMGGLLFGYDIGVISGVLLFIRKDFALSSVLEGVLVSFVLVGGVIGVLVAGYLSDVKGRKQTIAYASVLFSVGALVMALCPTGFLSILIIGRLIVGLGIGLSAMTIPLFIAEIAPAEHRGKLVSADELFIVFGIFLSFVMNWIAKVSEAEQPWRFSFGISVAFALIQLFGLYFLPESPRWLIAQNRAAEARRILRRVRSSDEEVKSEMAHIRAALNQFGFSINWRQNIPRLIEPGTRKALLISVTLAFFVQFTGQPTVLYFSAKVIESTKSFGTSGALFAISALPMLIKLIATAIATFGIVDQFGRRKPLMVGMGVMALFLFSLGGAFYVEFESRGWVVVVFLSFYVAAFAIGLGPVCFVVFSEIFPAHLRAIGQSVSLASMLFFNLIVSLTFQSMAEAFGVGTVFIIYGIISIIGVAFIYFFLPETNGKSLEDSAKLFRASD